MAIKKKQLKKLVQLSLFGDDEAIRRVFGGALLHGRRRNKRPLVTREPIHLVLRSCWARGRDSLLAARNQRWIECRLIAIASRYGVRIYRRAIASNHIHLVIRIHNRTLYKAFVRVLSGRIASHVMRGRSFEAFKAEQLGRGLKPPAEVQGLGQRFFQFRPFSRLVKWGRDFKSCCGYVVQNTLEALGFIEYKPRKNRRYDKLLSAVLEKVSLIHASMNDPNRHRASATV